MSDNLKSQKVEAKTVARIVHALPGRIRLRLPDRRQDVDYFKQILNDLSAITGVDKLVINPRTASVFIQYDTGSTNALNQFLEKNDLFAIQKETERNDDPGEKASQRLSKILSDAGITDKTDVSPTILMSMALAGWSCYKMTQGEWKSPAWYVTLWYAYNLYRDGMAEMENSSPTDRADAMESDAPTEGHNVDVLE